MKLKIVLAKCEIFVTLFQRMTQFTEHVNMIFSEEGLYIQGMDHSHIIIFELTLPGSWFDSYELEEKNTIGINTHIFSKVLGVYQKTQYIDISTTERDVLSVEFKGSDNKSVFDKSLEVPLLDIEYDLMEIPEIDYQAEISLDSSTFSTVINQLKQFGESMTITCSEEEINLSSHSEDKGKMTTNIPIDDVNEFAIEEGETLEMSFALKYIHDVSMYQKIANTISVHISKDMPMKMYYNLSSNDEEKASLVFYMAPRIDD